MKTLFNIKSLCLSLLLAASFSFGYLNPSQTTLSTAAAVTLIHDSTADVRDSAAAWAGDSVSAHVYSTAFNATVTGDTVGVAGVVTDSVYINISGNAGQYNYLAQTGVSSTTGLSLSACPSAARPARAQNVMIYGITDNGSAVTTNVTATLGTNGVLTFNRTFTNTSTKALAAYTFAYSLR